MEEILNECSLDSPNLKVRTTVYQVLVEFLEELVINSMHLSFYLAIEVFSTIH